MISPSILVTVALRLRNAVWGETHCTDVLSRPRSMHLVAFCPVFQVGLKNLGAILGKEGDSLRALYYLRRSYEIDPLDPQTVYGLAFAR
jgi:hypothetical protein